MHDTSVREKSVSDTGLRYPSIIYNEDYASILNLDATLRAGILYIDALSTHKGGVLKYGRDLSINFKDDPLNFAKRLVHIIEEDALAPDKAASLASAILGAVARVADSMRDRARHTLTEIETDMATAANPAPSDRFAASVNTPIKNNVALMNMLSNLIPTYLSGDGFRIAQAHLEISHDRDNWKFR